MKLKKYKVGHAGTLDPMATGLLIICVSKFTKKLEGLMGLSKTYEGKLKLGETTPSFDTETLPDIYFPPVHPEISLIKQKAKTFTGVIMQYPPIFSALKKGGIRMYKLARQGKEVTVEPRRVYIKSFEIDEVILPFIRFTVTCSKGTYIRSLAHDLGKSLGSGAHLVKLRRTEIGPYSVKDAWQPDELVSAIKEVLA